MAQSMSKTQFYLVMALIASAMVAIWGLLWQQNLLEELGHWGSIAFIFADIVVFLIVGYVLKKRVQ